MLTTAWQSASSTKSESSVVSAGLGAAVAIAVAIWWQPWCHRVVIG